MVQTRYRVFNLNRLLPKNTRILARTTCLLQIKDTNSWGMPLLWMLKIAVEVVSETQLKGKLPPSSSCVVDFKYAVPDINETAPEPESSGDDNKGSTFSNVSSSMADLEVVVKIIRELEIKGHLKLQFRLKFFSWYSLRATEKEREVVCAYIRTVK